MLFRSALTLLAEVEAVDIVVPTLAHHEVATAAFRLGKHVFVEKPLTHTVAEGEALLKLQTQHPQLIGQVGHVERFNPAFLAISDRMLEPMFVEAEKDSEDMIVMITRAMGTGLIDAAKGEKLIAYIRNLQTEIKDRDEEIIKLNTEIVELLRLGFSKG